MRDHLSMAADYQAGVLAGSIPACQWVKRACERNRRDLDRQETDAFPYRFDPDSARKICQFAELLPHVKGPADICFIRGYDDQERPIWNPLVLEPWQCWVLTVLFGWLRTDGLRRFRIGLVLVPRKNGKSVLGAIVALYLFATEGTSGECYSAATTRDQAKIVAEIAWEMARRSPQFLEAFGVRLGSRTTRTLSIPATGAKFSPLSADAQSLDGLNILLAIVDELHAHKTASRLGCHRHGHRRAAAAAHLGHYDGRRGSGGNLPREDGVSREGARRRGRRRGVLRGELHHRHGRRHAPADDSAEGESELRRVGPTR
jgi:phage terminase large subunit-like protein